MLRGDHLGHLANGVTVRNLRPIEVGASETKELQTRLRNTFASPVGNGGISHFAQLSDGTRAAKTVDDQIRDRVVGLVHGIHLSTLKAQGQGTLKSEPFKLPEMNSMISRLLAARAWREEKRGHAFTNAEFARGLKVQQASVNYWLDKGEGDLKTETVFQASDFLHVDARWLATGEGRMSSNEESPEPQADVIARLADGTTIIMEAKKSHAAPPDDVKAAVQSLMEAYTAGAPRELFDAVRVIFSLLPRQSGANIKPSHKARTGDLSATHSASKSIDARAAWEEQEAENSLRASGGDSRGTRATGERKRKGARH